jgi:hypothetical protein
MRQREGTQDLEEAPVESGQLAWGKLLSLNKIKLNSYDLKDREVSLLFHIRSPLVETSATQSE